MQIDMTWNLFLTAILIPVLGWYLRLLIIKNDTANEDRHKAIIKLFDENREDHAKIFAKGDDHERRISFIEGKTTGHKAINA